MNRHLISLTGNILLVILMGVVVLALGYSYTHASQEDQDSMFWFMVTQPQE